MPRVIVLALAAVMAAGMVVSGCAAQEPSPPNAPPVTGDTVDGFKLGVTAHCSPPVDVDAAVLNESCAGYPDKAREALDARDPGHAKVVSVDMYTDGTQPEPIDVTGNASPPPRAPAHSGPNVMVFVFTLADGSTRATGVACLGVSAPSCVGIGAYPSFVP